MARAAHGTPTPWTYSRAEPTMKEAGDAEGQGGAPSLESLLEQRRRIEEWLQRLDEGSDVPSHIAERVRADYRERLERLTQELSSNREALEQELHEREKTLDAARARLAAGQERLDESRLRHAVGEYDAEVWSDLRSELEEEVTAAEEEARIAGEEAERVRGTLAEMGAGGGEGARPAGAPGAPEPAEPAKRDSPPAGPTDEGARAVEPAEEETEWEPDFGLADFGPEAESLADPQSGKGTTAGEGAPATEEGEEGGDDPLPWLEFGTLDPGPEDEGSLGEPPAGASSPAEAEPAAPAPKPGPASKGRGERSAPESEMEGEDLDFLRDLDRALSTGSGAGKAPPASTPPPAQGSSERLSCPECGASNDARAWYCEICGTELT
jgi:hypothetical protein